MLLFLRDGEERSLRVQPALNGEGKPCLGLWLRESSAGIGTLSFYDPQSDLYGALGHGITDVDLGSLLPLERGSLLESRIVGLTPGLAGLPGEIHGVFSGKKLGTVEKNSPHGVFGSMEGYVNPFYPQGLPLAYPDEVRPGRAELLTSLDETGMGKYACEILLSDPESPLREKGILLKITDPVLLEKSGGIVQGMSGSPIIQDGKLVGAVTHVLVNDPTRGYGIFIENMLEAAG